MRQPWQPSWGQPWWCRPCRCSKRNKQARHEHGVPGEKCLVRNVQERPGAFRAAASCLRLLIKSCTHPFLLNLACTLSAPLCITANAIFAGL
jgi:hypothetical protein